MLDRGQTLVAVLLNPPSATSGRRTRNAVALAGEVLGFSCTEIVNIAGLPTPTVLELNGTGEAHWLEARHDIRVKLGNADALLGGWGTTGLHGPARRLLEAQVVWLANASRELGLVDMWTVGGKPRHPSRWHQYVAEKHGRATGVTFAERLQQVLVRASLPAGG